MAEIGGISIGVTANTAAVQSNLDKASKAFNSFGAKANTALNMASKASYGLGVALGSTARIAGNLAGALVPAVGIIGGGLVTAIGAGIRASAKWASDLEDLSARASVSAQTIQELEFAGIRLGVASSSITNGLEKANTVLGQFITDGGGPAAEVFNNLGIAAKITSGELRTTEEVVLASLDAIGGLSSQAEKAAAASAIFGRKAGPDLATFVSNGSDALKAARQEARDLGLVLDDVRLNSLGKVDEAFDGLTTLIGRQFTAAVASAGPQIVQLTGELAAATPKILSFIQQIAEALDLIEETPLRAASKAREKATKELEEALRNRNEFAAKVKDVPAFITDRFKLPLNREADSARTRLEGAAREEERLRREQEQRQRAAAALLVRAPAITIGGRAGGGRSGGRSSGGQTDTLADQLAALGDRLSGPAERAIKQFGQDAALLKTAFEKGAIGADEFAMSSDRLKKGLDALAEADLIKAGSLKTLDFKKVRTDFEKIVEPGLKVMRDAIDEAERLGKRLAEIGGTFGDRIVDGLIARDLSGVARGFFSDLTRAFLDELIGSPLNDLGKKIGRDLAASIRGSGSSNSGGGGFLAGVANLVGSLFGGARANGGPVSGGKAYLVGERGPEIFAPGGNGGIIANSMIGAARPQRSNLVINVSAEGAVLRSEIYAQVYGALAAAQAPTINSSVAVADRRNRNRLR